MASLSPEAERPPFTLSVASGASLLLLERGNLIQRASFKTGIKSVDAQFPDLFSSGCVIGIGQPKDAESGSTLFVHILATTLAPSSTSLPGAPTRDLLGNEGRQVFILAPPTSSVISDLHTLLQARVASTRPGLTEEHSVQLLDSVKLLQYLDLAGLAEGLSEISQTLHDQQQECRGKSILLVKGLSDTLATVLRRSGTTQVAALTSNLLRIMIHLSRTYPELLVLVELVIDAGHGDKDVGAVLESAFAAEKGGSMGIVPRGVVGDVLEHGMDVVLVVHDGFCKTRRIEDGGAGVKTRIAEVVKDRAGKRLGEWCTWVQ